MLLTDTNNGTFNCSLGDDGEPSYEDTCNLTCNHDYQLVGNGTRICQSDGNWSNSDGVCRKGIYGLFKTYVLLDVSIFLLWCLLCTDEL